MILVDLGFSLGRKYCFFSPALHCWQHFNELLKTSKSIILLPWGKQFSFFVCFSLKLMVIILLGFNCNQIFGILKWNVKIFGYNLVDKIICYELLVVKANWEQFQSKESLDEALVLKLPSKQCDLDWGILSNTIFQQTANVCPSHSSKVTQKG